MTLEEQENDKNLRKLGEKLPDTENHEKKANKEAEITQGTGESRKNKNKTKLFKKEVQLPKQKSPGN